MSEPGLHTPDQAEAAFYLAFEQADFASMMAVWSATEDIVCIHPNGPCLTGRDEVGASWRQILSGQPRLRFRINAVSTTRSDDLAIHLVQENIHVGQTEEPDFVVVATNIYSRGHGGWRMILHHASPSPQASKLDVSHRQEEQGKTQILH